MSTEPTPSTTSTTSTTPTPTGSASAPTSGSTSSSPSAAQPTSAQDPEKIYEGASLTVSGQVEAKYKDSVEEVTFKFFIDGKANTDTDKTIPISEGTKETSGAITVKHTLPAMPVADDKDSYILDYHVFYKVKNQAGDTTEEEIFGVKKFEVMPRTAQLKVLSVTDGTTVVPNFQFRVLQAGKQFGGVQSTFAEDTTNAKEETVPAGSAEFNLGMHPGFTIVQASPCEISEQTVVKGRKREVKGEIKFKACFIAPRHGSYKQWVNEPLENHGQSGKGNEVLITVGVEGDEDRNPKIGNEKAKVHFRVTFGPDDTATVKKSARNDTDNPTKAVKKSDDDTTATIDEKTANKKYEGNVTLGGGTGSFKVQLGSAGGDTCLIEICGSDKFLTDTNVLPDQTLTFENWRRVHYELMVPDIMKERVLAEGSTDLSSATLRRIENLGKQIFVEFALGGTQVFEAMASAGQGTLLRKKFLKLRAAHQDEPGYVLTGNNWRELPDNQNWPEKNPGRTLYMTPCDAMLQWRKDTSDPSAATKDYSSSFTAPIGSIDIEATFSGLFMPYSGNDGGDGIGDIKWTADIANTDSCAKYTVALTFTDPPAPEGSASTTTTTSSSSSSASASTSSPAPSSGSPAPTPSPAPSPSESTSSSTTAPTDLGPYGVQLNVSKPDSHNILIGFEIENGAYRTTLSNLDAYALLKFYDDVYNDVVREVATTKGAMSIELVTGPAVLNSADCISTIKDFLNQKLTDSNKDLVYHPGLDGNGNARTGTFALGDITDGDKSTIHEWHYALPVADPDGAPGPGAYVGASKTAEQCPIKIEFSVQPHVSVFGAADGRLLAWVANPTKGDTSLIRLILTSISGSPDDKAVAHGHTTGKPGDCLDTADTLCDACIAFGRSKRLDFLP